MKKLIFTLFILVYMLSGCSFVVSRGTQGRDEKLLEVEIYSVQEDSLLATVQDQDITAALTESYNWKLIEDYPDGLVPEYRLVVYQEKTLLYGKDPDEPRDYEVIETLITFKDSPYVAEMIEGSVVKNMKLPEDALTSYYLMPDETIRILQGLVE